MFVIKRVGSGLCWSNEVGWTSLDDATRFTEDEQPHLSLPLEGEWFQLPHKLYLLNVDKADLVRQIETLSGLLQHLNNKQYEETVGALRLLEEIRDYKHDEED